MLAFWRFCTEKLVKISADHAIVEFSIFIRLFSEAYNTPPQKYLTAIRMRHACSMLKSSDMNVTEISVQCGFNDPNYFSRIFKKNMGITPLQYRKDL